MTSIKFETLKKEYENTLKLYDESIQNYIDIISSNNKNDLVTLNGRTWWGENGIAQGFSENINTCKALCKNIEECSGATFNDVKKYCWTRRGNNGFLTLGTQYDYAIISKEKAAYFNMKGLNNRLIQINEEIIQSLKYIDIKQTTSDLENSKKNLVYSYNKLLDEKKHLDLLMNEYLNIDKTLNNQELFADQQNSLLRMWTIIVCIILLLVLKGLLGVSSLPIELSFWFIIIILLLLLSFMLKTASGFFILSLIIIGIIFSK